MKKLVLHLMSESSGQTVKYIANSALSRFVNVETKKYYWPMIKNVTEVNAVINKIAKMKKRPSIVLHSIFTKNMKKKLESSCNEIGVMCISVIDQAINAISKCIGRGAEDGGMYLKLDEDYFDKMQAIDFTLRHDDGNLFDSSSIKDADIILVGPSRTSKTPTAVFLAYNGLKVMNVPYVHGSSLPSELLFNNSSATIVGFTIAPKRLLTLRESRMDLINFSDVKNYTNIDVISSECREIKNLCKENNWLIMDVSFRSIEENAAIIMSHHYKRVSYLAQKKSLRAKE